MGCGTWEEDEAVGLEMKGEEEEPLLLNGPATALYVPKFFLCLLLSISIMLFLPYLYLLPYERLRTTLANQACCLIVLSSKMPYGDDHYSRLMYIFVHVLFLTQHITKYIESLAYMFK